MEIPPGTSRHFKGGEYEVLGLGRHSETLEELVFYRALYTNEEFENGALWARPVALFTDTVEVAGEKIPRFKKI